MLDAILTRPTSGPAGAGRRVLVVVVLCLVGWVAGAGPALAHASLVETEPFDGSALEEPPELVELTFNEPMTVVPGGVRVFDTAGERVDDGEVQLDPADDRVLLAGLEPGLDDGGYVVTWRAVSADGHPVRGAFVFTVGPGQGASDDVVAALFAGGDAPVAGVLATANRVAGYAGVLVALGAALFALVVAQRPMDRVRAAAVARRAAPVALASAALAVPLQAMVVTGLGLAALTPSNIGAVALGPVGLASIVTAAGAAGMRFATRGPGRRDGGTTGPLLDEDGEVVGVRTDQDAPFPRSVPLLVGASAVAALGYVLEGHTRTQSPGWLMLSADVVHVLTVGAWVGGLVVLALVLAERRRADDPVGAARLVAAFSRLALVTVLAGVVAGTAQSWVTVRALRALTTTSYGWTLVAKVVVVALLLAAGLYNQRVLLPRIVRAARADAAGATEPAAVPVVAGGAVNGRHPAEPVDEVASVESPEPAGDGTRGEQLSAISDAGDGAWGHLRRTVRLEVLGLVLVVAATALLVTLQPAAQAAGITGAFSAYVALDDEGREVNLVVDPNRAGFNSVHLYVLDATGRPAQDITAISVGFSMPARDIGPLVREPFVAGPGHWQVDGNTLSVPGEWVIEVEVETDRFDLDTAEVRVVVNS